MSQDVKKTLVIKLDKELHRVGKATVDWVDAADRRTLFEFIFRSVVTDAQDVLRRFEDIAHLEPDDVREMGWSVPRLDDYECASAEEHKQVFERYAQERALQHFLRIARHRCMECEHTSVWLHDAVAQCLDRWSFPEGLIPSSAESKH